ncbi:unnamed protein product [Paramecium sonneborni]|uniref:Uncharacterized protein n=1 Tax=Paramecium sonneborni TaxID=65129 RepID=A0A8S1L1N9_9CILI|nr:unnamed protein product [Paramecium sonneborni]
MKYSQFQKITLIFINSLFIAYQFNLQITQGMLKNNSRPCGELIYDIYSEKNLQRNQIIRAGQISEFLKK